MSSQSNDETEETVTPNTEEEPIDLSMKKDVKEEISHVEEISCPNKCQEETDKETEGNRTELLTKSPRRKGSCTKGPLNGFMRRIEAFRRKLKRGSRVYKCLFCDYKCAPGNKWCVMKHMNGYQHGKKYLLPCKARLEARPAKNGVFEKLEPTDITDQETGKS